MSSETAAGSRAHLGRLGPLLSGSLVGTVAFLLRLSFLLRGGGLYGYGNYDDGVYFASALALVNGRLPYRDFLMLHPPGITVALSPFGALAQLVGEPTAFAVARLCWMVLGAASAAVVVAILWPQTRFGAVAGGLFYALYYPALFTERLTLLEAPQTLALLLTLLVLSRALDRPSGWAPRPWPWLGAGLLLGLCPTFKIWGVVPVLLITGWIGVAAGGRRLAQLLAGVAITGLAVYLPFFLTVPALMWRYLVLDQFGRQDAQFGVSTRLVGIAGLQRYGARDPSPTVVAGMAIAAVIVIGLALAARSARIYLVLLTGLMAVLLSTPAWFQHYPALLSGPLSLVVGTATGVLLRRLWHWRVARIVPVLLLGSILGCYLAPLVDLRLGAAFPQARLAVARQTRGCVTSDDPTNLIELDLIGADIARGCPTVIDLGGYAYDLRVGGLEVGRKANPAWQREAMSYLGSGSATILSRLNTPRYNAFTRASRRQIASWPKLARVGRTVVRAPGQSTPS